MAEDPHKDLAGFIAAVKSLLQLQIGEVGTYTDALITEALRQALREYSKAAAPVSTVLAVESTGRGQRVDGIACLLDVVLIAYPWEATEAAASGVDVRERIVRWRLLEPGRVWIEDFEPQAGEHMLVYYRAWQTVDGLDGSAASTVPLEHESLVVLGAAAWATEIHYRGLGEAVKGPTEDQVKRIYTWSHLRLNEFRNALRDLAWLGGPVRPAWGHIGL